MSTKTPLETIQEFAQGVLGKAPVIVLGSGASAAHGVPGMYMLGEHLRSLKNPGDWNPHESDEWDLFCSAIKNGMDLESALFNAKLSDKQTVMIVNETRTFLLKYDLEVFDKVLSDRHTLPLTALFDHLFRSTHRELNVVTTNYDRIAEYAADAGGHSHFTGFEYGHLQQRAKDAELRIYSNRLVTRTVCVWKVHGSLDWFKDDKNQIIAARASIKTPKDHTPLVVTPGVDKYRQTHGEPFRTIFACADKALEKAESYFCVGYGFNDEHVQSKLIEQCEKASTPLLLLTQKVSPTTKTFLAKGLCKKYLALEASETGTLAISPQYPHGVNLPGEDIWQLPSFLKRVIGVNP